MMGVLSGLPSCPTVTPPRTVVLAVHQALRDEMPHLIHNTQRGPYTPFMQEEPRALRHGSPMAGRAELSPQPSAPRPPPRLLALLTSCCCFSSSRLTVLQPMFSSPSDSEPPLAERSSSRSKS